MLLQTTCGPWRKALATNSADSSFPSRIPRASVPSTDGVVKVSSEIGMGIGQNCVKIMPYALADDDATFSIRLIGWDILGNDPGSLIWIPNILGEYACTVSSMVGLAGRLVLNTERFADTITLVTGNDDVSLDIVSPTGNVGATVVVDLKGSQYLEFTFDTTGGSITGMNCLYKLY